VRRIIKQREAPVRYKGAGDARCQMSRRNVLRAREGNARSKNTFRQVSNAVGAYAKWVCWVGGRIGTPEVNRGEAEE